MQDFQKIEADIRHRYNKVGAVTVMLTMPMGSILDHFNYPAHADGFFLLRLLGSFLMLGIFAFDRLFRRQIQLASAFVTYTPILLICIMIALGNNPDSDYHEGLNLVLIGGGILLRWNTIEAISATIFALVAYLTSMSLSGGIEAAHIGSNLFFLGVTGSIVSLGCHYYYRLRENDVTLRNKLEQQNRELLQLDAMKNQFLANVSHELRTPLTLILGPLETFSRTCGELPETARGQLRIMRENGFRLLRLIDNLLDLMRLNLANAKVKLERVDYGSFMKGLLASIQPMASEKNIALRLESSPLPEYLLLDKQKLERIFLNLLINAIKFSTERGNVTIRVDYADDGLLTTKVVDSGMGMTQEEQTKVFEAFWQADTSTTRQFKGAGIGLALVKGLVEVLEGEIYVKSEKGYGSEFTVRFKADVPDDEHATETSPVLDEELDSDDALQRISRLALLEGGPSTVRRQQTLSPMISAGHKTESTIIVADDEPSMLQFMSEALQLRFPANQILTADNGTQALELTKQHNPGALVLDHMMPGLDGIEVCRRLKQEVGTRDVAILMITAHADEATRLECLEAGATDFLNKPFSVVEFEVRLQNMLNMKSFQQELQQKNSRLERAMEDLKDYEAQLVNSAKMASLGRMSAGLIHEINNPLNYSIVAARILKQDFFKDDILGDSAEEVRDLIADIEDGVTRVSNIISDLRVFTHDKKAMDNPVNLSEVINQTRRILQHQLKLKEVEWKSDLAPDLEVLGNQNQLVQVFVNLAQNSIDALAGSKQATKTIAVTGERQHNTVVVVLEDNGPGISQEVLPEIFEPFYSNKEVGEGMGLGLSICYNIIKSHGGRINVESEEGEFCRFLINLQPYNLGTFL